MAHELLRILQAVSVAMVGLAVWLIAGTLGLPRGKKHAALLYVLASPAAYWAIVTELHLTGLSMGLDAMTVAGTYRRWRLRYFWILPLLASLGRIDIALTVVIVGLRLTSVSRAHARMAIVRTLATDYEVVEAVDRYTVRRILPEVSPTLVDERKVVWTG